MAKPIHAATEFVSIIDPDSGPGTDYSSLSGWQNAVKSDLTSATTKVFSYNAGTASGTIADGVTVVGYASGAVATSTHRTATSTSHQIFLTNIYGTFQSGETVYIQGQASTTNFVVLSDAGDSAIAVASCRSTNGSIDQTAVTISGWNTASTTFIKIWTDPSVGARHNGKWDDSKYRLSVSGPYGYVIGPSEEYIWLDGLQIENTGTRSTQVKGVRSQISNPVSLQRYSNLIVRASGTGTPDGQSIAIYMDGSMNYQVWNNLTYGYYAGIGNDYESSAYSYFLYNNTVVDSNGIGISVTGNSNPNYRLINNLAYGNAIDYSTSNIDLAYNNLSRDGTAPGSFAKTSSTVAFVDVINKDYHLSSSDTGARNAGTSTPLTDANLSFSQDIDGSYRGAAWDIGADEVATEFVSTICENVSAGGGCATMDFNALSAWEAGVNSDLIASGTRVFSGIASGTLAVGNTVTLYNGATSTGITGTIKATTSNQILITGITGTSTIVNVASGTVWQVATANAWRNAGTLDQLGASPIAVAKIDGAWANPDSNPSTIFGWTTSADNYIRVYATSLARHSGKWDSTKYRLDVAGGSALILLEDFVRVEGLQLANSAPTGNGQSVIAYGGVAPSLNNKIVMSGLVIKGHDSPTYWQWALGASIVNLNVKIENTLVYNVNTGPTNSSIYLNLASNAHVYNTTVIGGGRAIQSSSNGRTVFKNVISQSSTNGFFGTFATSSDFNISDFAGNAPNATFATTSKVVQFVSTSTGDFHLADNDTAAKGLGANLYNDANINVTNDIDGAARPVTSSTGLPWDIGADQTATKIYRSIAPSATTALTTGASNAMTITNTATTSTAVFVTALADNIGVGDVIIYNASGTATSTAFISGRASSTQYTIQTATGTLPTVIAGDTSWSIYRAYTSLVNAEAGTENTGIVNATIRNFDAWSGGDDLVASNTQWNIAAYANGTATDSPVTISGWNTGQQNYVKVFTPKDPAEVGVSQRHQGKWSDDLYRLEIVSNSNGITISVPYARIEGMQIRYMTGAITGDKFSISTNLSGTTTANIYVHNNILRGIAKTAGSWLNGYGDYLTPNNQTTGWALVTNNIIYGFDAAGGQVCLNGNKVFNYALNNTVYDCYMGIQTFSANRVLSVNNISYNNTDNYSGTFLTGSSNNLSGPTQNDAPGTSAQQAKTVQFVDEVNADFHLSPLNTTALDTGTSTPINYLYSIGVDSSYLNGDTDGNYRRQWDIGADEASVEYVTTVMEVGGNFSTLSAWESANQVDLVATATAVFSVSLATGAIPTNSTVIGLISGAQASTSVGSVSTSTQILLYNITASSTGQSFLAGETVYIKGGSTSTNNVVISNLGNPTIAAAKIDGAWMNPDTTAITFSGWTSGPTNYMRVYTAPASRHNGKWDDEKYILATTQGNVVQVDFLRLEGLQMKVTRTDSGVYHLNLDTIASGGEIQLYNNIMRGVVSGAATNNLAIRGNFFTGSTRTLKAWNNIIYDYKNPNDTMSVGISINGGWKAYVYNNTLNNVYYGFYNNTTFVAKNNILNNCIIPAGGAAYSLGTDYNITSSSTVGYSVAGGGNTHDKVLQNVAFVDAANGDFHLSSTDTIAKDAGASALEFDPKLSFVQDIDGSYRGAAWDIGADEVPTEFVSTICENTTAGGSCATLDFNTLSAWEAGVNSDLTASTTRVFSGTASGTLAVGNSVTLYNGAVSTGVTGTIKATTSNQILITGITGTSTIVSVASGTVWRVTAANAWRNAGTLDQLGASPIAEAKIDGAWASSDTSNVVIYGWTSGVDNYIRVYTTALARHPGKWDNSKYRLETPLNSESFIIREEYFRVEGLQIKVSADFDSSSYAIDSYPGGGLLVSDVRISGNIIKGAYTGTANSGVGIAIEGNHTAKVYNNIIYDIINGANSMRGAIRVYGTNAQAYVYNNTVFNSYIGINRGSPCKMLVAKNNIAYSNNDNYSGSFDTGSTNNLSGPTQADAPGTNPQNSKVVSFISTSTVDFHLADNDTVAKGQGLNIANDPYIPLSGGVGGTARVGWTDIDEAARPVATTTGIFWDIGADQTAIKIYRSIAPGATTALSTGAGNPMTITSTATTSLATFDSGLATNIGVGDVIIYNTAGMATNTAFISGRASSTQYTVQTASGTLAATVADDTTWSIYRAYTSLSNAEAGTENTGIPNATIRNFDTWSGGAELVASNTQWNIAAYANGVTADTNFVTIDGWNTSQQNFIRVYTPVGSSEVGISQRHQGKWDDNRYYLSAGNNDLLISDEYVWIDGIQMKTNCAGNGYGIRLFNVSNAVSSEIKISNNIIQALSSSGTYNRGIRVFSGRVVKIYNNIIYGFTGSTDFGINIDGTGTTTNYIYNNTLNNNFNGINESQVGNFAYIKNNLVQGASDGYYSTNAWLAGSDNNISNVAADITGQPNSKNATNVSFIDGANNDLHLISSDASASDAGTSSPQDSIDTAGLQNDIIYDIDGQLRRQWDIGADEASVEYVTTVMESGGNFSTLSAWESANQVDLAATSTAVFSVSLANGTIPANSTVVGLTSGAVASTTVGSVSSSTQILFYNIIASSTTGQSFVFGETVYIKGASPASNYVTISNLGNPAIATAKIDGAWSSPNTGAVVIDGWTTGRNNFIKIYTTNTARHGGKWDASKFRLEHLNGVAMQVNEENVRVDGLQLALTAINSGNQKVLQTNQTTNIDFQVSNNIIKGVGFTDLNWHGGIVVWSNSTGSGKVKIWNNIVYDFGKDGASVYAVGIEPYINGVDFYISNNTVYNCQKGIGRFNGNVTLKNNIAHNNNDGYYGSFIAASDFNVSNIVNDAPNATFASTSKVVKFVDVANGDFHLDPADSVAKDMGADLSVDVNLPLMVDIDGQYRGGQATSSSGGLGWDIGADEGSTPLYRSVGNDTNNLNSGGAVVTITNSTSSSLATFDLGLAPNIGVGDVIQYGSPLTLAFISGRASSTTYSVVNSTGGFPVATTSATASIYRAHPLLENWQGQTTTRVNQSINSGLRSLVLVARDLVASNTAMFVPAYASSSPDNTSASVNGWVTGPGNIIKIYTPTASSEVGVSQRHTGKWSEEKFRMEVGNTTCLVVRDEYVIVEGLQLYVGDPAGSGLYNLGITDISANNKIQISNNIIRGFNHESYYQYGMYIYDTDVLPQVYNNLIYNFNSTPTNGRAIYMNASTSHAYNNTIVGPYYGVRVTAGNSYLKNNIIQGAIVAFSASGGTGAIDSTSDYNISNDNTAPGVNSKKLVTVKFVDETNDNFHLAQTDRVARDAGVSLSTDAYMPFVTDIDGSARPQGGVWDIGADEATDEPDFRFNGFFKMNGFFKFK